VPGGEIGAVAFPLQIFSWWPFAVVRRRAAVAAVGWSGEGAEEVATHLQLDRLWSCGWMAPHRGVVDQPFGAPCGPARQREWARRGGEAVVAGDGPDVAQSVAFQPDALSWLSRYASSAVNQQRCICKYVSMPKR
jgi:hypothetical protein